MQLEGLEDQLLQRLADAPADILADVDLIEVCWGGGGRVVSRAAVRVDRFEKKRRVVRPKFYFAPRRLRNPRPRPNTGFRGAN